MSDDLEFTLGSTSAESDEFTLGPAETEEFSLGSVEADEKKSTEVDSAAAVTPEPKTSEKPVDDGRCSVDEFYEKIVRPFRDQSHVGQFRMFLQQGNIESSLIYKIAGVNPFQEPTAEDRARIQRWGNEWRKEAEEYRNDGAKQEAVGDAISVFVAFFVNEEMNRAFNAGNLQITWNKFDLLVKETCRDLVVDLQESASLYAAAREQGLYFDDKTRKEFSKRLTSEIVDVIGAKIEDVGSEMAKFFDMQKFTSPANVIDSMENRVKFAAKYKELLGYQCQIDGMEYSLSDTECLEQFEAVLNKADRHFLKPVDFFVESYYNNFKQTHTVSKLSEAEYFALKERALGTFKLSEEDWKSFEKKSKISYKSSEELSSQLEKEKAKVKVAGRNGVIRNSLIVAGVIVGLALCVVGFRFAFPVQYAAASEWIVNLVNPSEEAKARAEQARLEKDKERRLKNHTSDNLYVGSNKEYKTVQAAIDAALENDVIIVDAGIYHEAFKINKKVTVTGGDEKKALIGSGYFKSSDVPVFVLRSDQCIAISGEATLSGCVVTSKEGLSFDSFAKHLEDREFYEANRYNGESDSYLDFPLDPMDSAYVTLVRVTGNASIRNCLFTDTAQASLTFLDGSSSVSQCKFVNSFWTGVHSVGKAKVSVTDSDFYMGLQGAAVESYGDSEMSVAGVKFTDCAWAVSSMENSRMNAKNISCSNVKYGFNSEGSSVCIISDSQATGFSAGAIAKDNSSMELVNISFADGEFGCISEKSSSMKISGTSRIADCSAAGVALLDDSKLVASDVSVSNTPFGIELIGNVTGDVSKCNISNCESAGIYVGLDGQGNFSDITVTSCLTACLLRENAKTTFTGCSFNDSSYSGVMACEYSNNTFKKCTFDSNKSYGFAVQDTENCQKPECHNEFEDCTFKSNEEIAVYLDFLSYNVFKNCSFTEHANYTVYVCGESKTAMTDCSFTKNVIGLYAEDSSVVSIADVTATENSQIGFSICGGARFIARTSSFDKNKTGVYLSESSYAELEACSMCNNTSFGLYTDEMAEVHTKKCKIKGNGEKEFIFGSSVEPDNVGLKTSFGAKVESFWNSL